MEKRIVYKGDVYWLQTSGRYYQSRDAIFGERLLHRRVWAEAHGPIPDGYDIHHLDHDWTNSHLDNLEMVERLAHKRHHMSLLSDDQKEESRRRLIELAQPKAAEWHRSEVGRQWHSKVGTESWVGRQLVKANCTVCAVEYETYFPTRSRFCSHACEMHESYHSRQFTDRRICANCGNPFMANKYRTTACCSRKCANQKRGAEQRRAG